MGVLEKAAAPLQAKAVSGVLLAALLPLPGSPRTHRSRGAALTPPQQPGWTAVGGAQPRRPRGRRGVEHAVSS